ncbi:MAG: hypothetical protein KGL36_06765 [Gammaproteobacteria bacterium]|nr:hypothetical protein [Gammaproteobacteria bacterium]
MTRFLWLIRRELWEYRAAWILPAVTGVLLVLAASFGHVDVDIAGVRPGPSALGGALLFGFGIVFLFAMLAYSSWYLLDCLNADRRDRSILFWKSLPIGDAQTVLAKLATGLIAIPLVYFAAADVTTLAIAFIVSLRARAWIGTALWHPEQWLQLQALWCYLILTLAIWLLPVAGWLLLVSASVRRATVLWSLLPPVAAVWAERVFLGTNWVGRILVNRLVDGYPATAFHDLSGSLLGALGFPGASRTAVPASVWELLAPARFLAAPATWIGVGAGVVLVGAAIRLRARNVDP